MQSFSKEMLIRTLAHRGEAHIPCRFLLDFFLCCVAIATAHFQGEYFSPGGKQTQVRAGSRGQWCFFKETLSRFFFFFLVHPLCAQLWNTNISRQSGRDDRNIGGRMSQALGVSAQTADVNADPLAK